MRREFLKTLGAGAATFLMAQQLRAATPTGPGRLDRVVSPLEYGAKANGRDDDTLAVIRAAQAGVSGRGIRHYRPGELLGRHGGGQG